MQLVLTNKKPHSLITIIERRSLRTHDLHHGESCVVRVESTEEINEYRRSYEAFGVDISIKEVSEVASTPVEEKPAVEKPKRSRKKAPLVEEVPVEEVKAEPVAEAVVAEAPVEAEPVAEAEEK